ncbi:MULTISPECIES: formate dehydrogenase FDH3 subunit beta [Helicobacter]|uniref:Formate dehydrogenase iron-sulfur subunit n=1 Tax=Helicobacter gastrofelis TaxID=2849642 RepID=A0ABM7SI37_9HELI|nr:MULTISPECIES: formate dehydrogenase FDH3 subunit beta [Helicobacter]CRF46696.1 Formate dehydrogenase-O, iron-sulfur subunit; Putative formate dehydrogenase iron-sulfur subunit [Helicobacter heilmannii]CRF47357.1 Formate dehydrogenase-O, iron-sulfur subunit; Putative formate dehydrogenase iron-sulfur subunit [Helicobacter heilmannii]CRF49957.1 Formate dehydrogenase-O, iron-sulfur subunit; Putative formate dehydrogenase iron-sulfur subunit [Helicobacter heilmannii]BCZ19569.1 formate dehydrogen
MAKNLEASKQIPNANRMKFYCDDNRCISCFACSVACSHSNELEVGLNRRKVITLYEGVEGKEKSISIACQHCTDAPCAQVCPVDCFYIREDGIVLHNKETCIGCGYCLYACPFGAPQFPRDGAFGVRGVMDKCTMCAGGPAPTHSKKEMELYGVNRIASGQVPMCAATCSTNALLVGDALSIADIYRKRVMAKYANAQDFKTKAAHQLEGATP